MPRWIRIAILLFAISPGVRAGEEGDGKSLDNLIRAAEHEFYAVENPDRFPRVEATLDLIEKLYPTEPYSYWAKARLSFFKKEDFYLPKEGDKPEEIEKQKIRMGETCHSYADKCIKLFPKNAECQLLKGSCYATQASTWGAVLKSLRVCKPMDDAWAKAMKLPSDFKHQGGAPTAQLAQILRAILYRVMPDSWWFRFLAGIRGSKEKAYHWINEGVTGELLKEPMLVLEKAATMICYAREKKVPEAAVEGVALLNEGLKLPTRYPMDAFDKRNMQILVEKPYEACNYRRERFEDLSEDAISSRVR